MDHLPPNQAEIMTAELKPSPYDSKENKAPIFPFDTRLSFAPLIRHWETLRKSPNTAHALLAESLFERLEHAPAMWETIEDESVLLQHQDIVDILVSGLIPATRNEVQLSFISKPFNPKGFYFTPPFQAMVEAKKEGFLAKKHPESINTYLMIRPGVEILNRIYGQEISYDNPTIFTFQSPETGLTKHYKSEMDLRFTEIKAVKPIQPLSAVQINQILHNLFDLDLWRTYIPPDAFEFQGVVLINLIEVTEEEAISQLKYILLEKDAVVKEESIKKIETQLRTIFRLPDLRFGITALDCDRRSYSIFPYYLQNSFLSDFTDNPLDKAFNGSMYCAMCEQGQPILVENLEKSAYHTPLEKALLAKGIKNILLAPIKDNQGQVIGVLELGSPQTCEINSLVMVRLADILPLFSISVERKREEANNQIEAVIREQYTAVHPSVEWAFTESAAKLIGDRNREGTSARINPIVFHEVFPLYGQIDIVGSSKIRNEAIRDDLLENLDQAARVIRLAYDQLGYPLLDQLLMKVLQAREDIQSGIGSGDEGRILDLLHTEVEPFFAEIKGKSPELIQAVASYQQLLDPELGMIYNIRKKYEDSVAEINDMVSECLDKAEVMAQDMLPHYFEKYKTDGVEYNMYLGQSLLRNKSFDAIQLKNFRLWQLLLMCEVTRKVAKLRPQLPTPLTTAQLVLVHNSPLDIRFRMDEKRFDVDGAYNVRYEILKKRVDKALVEGTGERLTLSGKIAIVYTQDKEEWEYDTYLEYLVKKGHIEPEIERLKLASLQGVSGLRALRITVK